LRHIEKNHPPRKRGDERIIEPENHEEGKSDDPTMTTKQSYWPNEIRCEMNIPEWEKALEKAGLLPEFQDVVDGFQNGFDQGIPQHKIGNLPHYTPPNHASALQAREKITKSLNKEIAAGRMFGPFEKEQVNEVFPFFRTNPLGAVINGDGSLRPINDLSHPHGEEGIPSVNSFVDADDFKTTWDDFNTVATFFRKLQGPSLLAIFDWEKAYRQIPTARNQWPYLMIKDFDEKIILDTRITFGGVAGCGSFGRPADAWKLIMKKEFDLLEVFRWVDDNLFVKSPQVLVSMDDIVARSNVLGVKTNKTKFSQFSEEQKYIGFIWNGTDKTVRLPEGKIKERIAQVQLFLELGHLSDFRQVEILAGRLNHVSFILPQLGCYLCSLYRWLKSWRSPKATRPTPEDAKEDLSFWLHTLSTFSATRLLPNPNPTDIGWVGDASTSFGIGVLIGKKWTQLKAVKGWESTSNPPKNIAWLETVAIRIGLLMLKRLRATPGKRFIVWTDNTTAENAVQNRKSNDWAANEEWKRIQSLLIDLQIDLVAKRVSSKDNRADALSRGDASSMKSCNHVPVIHNGQLNTANSTAPWRGIFWQNCLGTDNKLGEDVVYLKGSHLAHLKILQFFLLLHNYTFFSQSLNMAQELDSLVTTGGVIWLKNWILWSISPLVTTGGVTGTQLDWKLHSLDHHTTQLHNSPP
jgi:hypothetical protein